jgi:outer membrane protein assembly factor BamB
VRTIRRRTSVALATALVVALPAVSASAAAPAAHQAAPRGWTSFGNGPQHDFVAKTSLTAADIGTLHQAWFFPTGDAVTATPTIAHGVAYFGSWDTKFYAVRLATGKLKWSFQLDSQTAVQPYPGENPRPSTSDGGLVTSSAWYEPGDTSHPDLVIFGGGFTLYALDADTGTLYWKHVYDGLPSQPPSPTTDPTRIFSSPIVEDGNVYVGVDTDGQNGERGYVVAASLLTGDPVWIHETDVSAPGKVLDDGCGGVWSSGTYLPVLDDVVFTVADCNNQNIQTTTAERVLSLNAQTGRIRWSTNVVGTDPGCDFDETGTSAGLAPDGSPGFLGAFGKNGAYNSLDPKTGAVIWSTRVVFGGSAGGFIGTPAYTGSVIYGATAIGDVDGPCVPGNPNDTVVQNPSYFAIDAATGAVLWDANDSQSFGATTYAGGFLFTGLVFDASAEVRDAATGAVVATLPLPNPSWSGIAVSRDLVVMGVGTSATGNPAGVVAFEPASAPTSPHPRAAPA